MKIPKDILAVFNVSEMLASKKAKVFFIGLLVWILAELGVPVEMEMLNWLLKLIGLYLGVQGLADVGKEGKEFYVKYLATLRNGNNKK